MLFLNLYFEETRIHFNFFESFTNIYSNMFFTSFFSTQMFWLTKFCLLGSNFKINRSITTIWHVFNLRAIMFSSSNCRRFSGKPLFGLGFCNKFLLFSRTWSRIMSIRHSFSLPLWLVHGFSPSLSIIDFSDKILSYCTSVLL